MSPVLSVLIVTYRDRDNLCRCLHSIHATKHDLPLEVLVYDNHSGDGTPAMVREHFPEVIVIEAPSNGGLTKGLNQCAARARGEFMLALDSDTIVHEGAMQTVLAFLQQHPEIGVAGGRLYYLDGSLQTTARRFPSVINAAFGRHTLLTRWFPGNPISQRYLMADLNETREWFRPDWVSAACMMIRASVFRAVGGFDERFFVYWSDADFCYRVRLTGSQIACIPGGRITHCERLQPGLKKTPRMIVDFHNGVYLFYTTHYASNRFNPLRWLAWVGLSLRATLCLILNSYKTFPRRGIANFVHPSDEKESCDARS